MIDYQVIFYDIPSQEAVTPNEDGSYTIFINKNLTYEQQQTAFCHAMRHIYNMDFDKCDACMVEERTHRKDINAF